MFLVAAVGAVDAALVCFRPYAELSPAELDALQQACNYLSLEVAKQQAVHAIEQRFAGEVLDMVQAGPQRRGRRGPATPRLRRRPDRPGGGVRDRGRAAPEPRAST